MSAHTSSFKNLVSGVAPQRFTNQVVNDVVLVISRILRIQFPVLLSLHVLEQFRSVRVYIVTVQTLTSPNCIMQQIQQFRHEH